MTPSWLAMVITLTIFMAITPKTKPQEMPEGDFEHSCQGEYCPSFLQKPPALFDGPASILLSSTSKSGCICKTDLYELTVCIGQEKCAVVPQDINVTTAKFKLVSTFIKKLGKDSFLNMRQLKDLGIEANTKLEEIMPGAFESLSNVEVMSISFNANLQYVHPESFKGLTRLRLLFLSQNNFKDIYMIASSLSVSCVPQLTDLILSENVFETIEESSFLPMNNTKVQKIDLCLCRIQYLHPKSFLPLKHLQSLVLNENRFNSTTITEVIQDIVLAKIQLKNLLLFNVGFRNSPPQDLLRVIAKSNVTNLSLVKNQFDYLDPTTFPEYSPSIKILDLREVSLLNMSNGTFRNLPNLQILLLSGNKLSTIPKDTLPTNLVFLDLQSNQVSFIPSYFNLPPGTFCNLINLVYLNLGYNFIEQLRTYTFEGLANLKVLVLKNATIFEIEDGALIPLENLEYLYLQSTYFVRVASKGVLNYGPFMGLRRLIELNLENCGISYINESINPFKDLVRLKRLSLGNNYLKTLNYVSILRTLQFLDLNSNNIGPWQKRMLSENVLLRSVDLNKNKVSYLSMEMLYDFMNLTSLYLNDNPLECFCHNFDIFLEWFSLTKNNFLLNSTVLIDNPMCSVPSVINNNTLIDFLTSVQNGSMKCDLHLSKRNLEIFVPSTIFIIFVLTGVITVYYYRWHIKYWIFLTRLYLTRKGKIKPSKVQNGDLKSYIYDAFVSYSSEDRKFVVELVRNLENNEPFLKLCVYERDFEIGTIISENVMECVARSRKTLLIISDNYAKSQWCRWESQIAEHHRLFFENPHGEYVDDSLILIKLGPVSKQNLTPTLRYLLKTRIYLEWETEEKKQKCFWSRLRKTLEPPEISQKLTVPPT